MNEKILILDFGSQYTQLIARRVRELNVYCEIMPYNKLPELDESIKGVILSVARFLFWREGFTSRIEKIIGNIPVLGVCYGAQYIANYYGGVVERSNKREYGKAALSEFKNDDTFFKGSSDASQVWMSHGDTITQLPEQFELIAGTEDIKVAAFRSKTDAFAYPVYCLQFHPKFITL